VLRPLLSLLLSASLPLTLTACGEGAAQAPGGVSPGEAEALEEAAAMLDARRLPPEALPPEAEPPTTAPEEKTADTRQPRDE
jgi:hypothetical protein